MHAATRDKWPSDASVLFVEVVQALRGLPRCAREEGAYRLARSLRMPLQGVIDTGANKLNFDLIQSRETRGDEWLSQS